MGTRHAICGWLKRMRHPIQYRNLRRIGFSKGAATWLLGSSCGSHLACSHYNDTDYQACEECRAER